MAPTLSLAPRRQPHATPRHSFLTRCAVLLAFCCGCALVATACDDGGGQGSRDVGADQTLDGDGGDGTDLEPDAIDGFDDHTVPALGDVAQFEALASSGIGGQQAVKFLVTDFISAPATRYYDSAFYTLHDEWYWFRLLNGEPAPGSTTAPAQGLSFASIEEVYTWARAQSEDALPLDLRWVSGDRLYSPEFYTLALNAPRRYGLGTILRFPARAEVQRPELWVFELEYQDKLEHPQLVRYFESLEATLPPAVASQLLWIVRSPEQETLARAMEAQRLAYHDRILRYDELVVPGEVEVYSEGLTAGRVLKVSSEQANLLQTARETDLLMLEFVPDYLPPAAGLVTAVPQTPLAHLNVLARNRGIPNAYLGGLMEVGHIDQLDRVRAPAILRAVAPDQLDIVAITEQEFTTWRNLRTRDPIAVPAVDPSTLELTLDLELLAATITDEDALEALRPVIGGKSAGFLGLLAPGTVTTPDAPLAITVRPYLEHFEAMRPAVTAAINEASFRSSARTRFLVLEGAEDYDALYTTAADREFRQAYFAQFPAGTPIGDLLRAGGVRGMLRALPMNAATRDALYAALEARYGHYAPQQGLRFRSSSSVEDIEGFNGAGLYDSNTGYLQPLVQPDPGERKKDIEWAIKKTWASYWSFEAFEERRLENVDHLSGAMAVLVHARFDDPKELDNGVFTFRTLPAHHADAFVMELNVQLGAESVTNPTPGLGALPEVDVVRLPRGATQPVITRVAASSLVDPGVHILDEADLLSIFEQARQVAEAWRERVNASLPAEQHIEVLTLDFEFREVDEDWPALPAGQTPHPSRIVIKQSRSLDPGLRGVPQTLLSLPIPRDLLARARRGERLECDATRFTLTTVEVYSDPLSSPDMGYSVTPFNAFLSVRFMQPVAELGIAAGGQVAVPWPAFDAAHPTLAGGGAAWDLEVELDAPLGALHTIRLDADGRYTLIGDGGVELGGSYACDTTVLLTTPEDYLRGLLEEKLAP